MFPRLIGRAPNSLGSISSRWELTVGATAWVISDGPDSHTVYVGLKPLPRSLLWEEKRVMPMLRGWSVRQIWCVDGWGVTFSGYSVEEVVAKMREVVLEGSEYWGPPPVESDTAPHSPGIA